MQQLVEKTDGASIHWASTLLARQGLPLAAEHLRWHRPMGPSRQQHLFLLDCSASMVESGAFAQAKGLLLQWLRWAYLRRERVALLCFGAGQTRWLLQPTRAPRWNTALIEPLLGGGGTPLETALEAAWKMASRFHHQESLLWVLSDFRSPDVLKLEQRTQPVCPHVLVDCDFMPGTASRREFGGARRLAQAWADTTCLTL